MAIYLPQAAGGRASIDALLFIHGLLEVCSKPRGVPRGLVADRGFQLGQAIEQSSCAAALIVPLLQTGGDKTWRAHGLDRPDGLNRLLEAVRAEIARKQGTAVDFDRLVVAGHSRAYGVLNPLGAASAADLATGALSRLHQVWALDSTYEWVKADRERYRTARYDRFDRLLQARPGVGVEIAYRRSSQTDQFLATASGNGLTLRAFDARTTSHCTLPREALPTLLAGLCAAPASTGVARELEMESGETDAQWDEIQLEQAEWSEAELDEPGLSENDPNEAEWEEPRDLELEADQLQRAETSADENFEERSANTAGTGGQAALSACEREIVALVAASPLPKHEWRGRGVAPIGYLNGMAITFARAYCKLRRGDRFATLMARKPQATEGDTDALAHLDGPFRRAGILNERDGADTLRHLFVLLVGLGMRESAGQFCQGVDASSGNQNREQFEAGLFQMSYSIGVGQAAHIPIHEFYEQLSGLPYGGLKPTFAQGVRCGRRPLTDTHDSAAGRFRNFCLTQPALYAELTALCVRYRRRHWGPINRAMVELDPTCDQLLQAVQAVVDRQSDCTGLLPQRWEATPLTEAELRAGGGKLANEESSLDEAEAPVFESEVTEAEKGEFRRFPGNGAAIEGGEAKYAALRPLLVAKFQSIDNAIAFYRGIGRTELRGARFNAHTGSLQPRLDAASRRIDAETGFAAAVEAVPLSIGGFNIRRNRNNPSALSEHSFGFAMDINANANPNFGRRFPGREVLALTGEALFTGEAVSKMAAGGTARELLPWARRIREASDRCKVAFADTAALERAMRGYIYGDGNPMRTAFEPDNAVELVPLVRAAAAAGAAAARKRLIDQLAGSWKNLALLHERRLAELVESQVGPLGLAKAKANAAARRKADQLEQDKVRAGTAKLAPAQAQALTGRHFEAIVRGEAAWAAQTLVSCWQIFQASFVRGKIEAGQRIAANSEAGWGTIAAHGFLNFPPELIAVLTASDGGNLLWLGVGRTKDFMHFELRRRDQALLF